MDTCGDVSECPSIIEVGLAILDFGFWIRIFWFIYRQGRHKSKIQNWQSQID
jgi:hypothetical protein